MPSNERREQVFWVGAGLLLVIPFVLGYLRGSAYETTSESVAGGVAALLIGLVVAVVLRAIWWLLEGRRPSIWSPWLFVIAAVAGTLGVFGSAGAERDQRKEEAADLAAEAEACEDETGDGPVTEARGLKFKAFETPEMEALVDQTGVDEAVTFYEVSVGSRLVAVIGVTAVGDDVQAQNEWGAGIATALGVEPETPRYIEGQPISLFAGPEQASGAFTTECYGVFVSTSDFRGVEFVAKRILAK